MEFSWSGMVVGLCSHLWLSTKDSAASVVLMLSHKMPKLCFIFNFRLLWAAALCGVRTVASMVRLGAAAVFHQVFGVGWSREPSEAPAWAGDNLAAPSCSPAAGW